MAGFDMPIEKLLDYRGSTPCPDDFEEYWKRGLNEMNQVDPQVELIRSEYQVPFAECFDLYFTGTKNARIYAQYMRPKGIQKPGPAMLTFHGYLSNCGDWTGRLPFIAAGISVVAMDCRGQAGQSQDVSSGSVSTLFGAMTRGLDLHEDQLMLRDVFLDAALLTKIIMGFEEIDPARVAVNGVSQGGGISIACAALVPQISLALIRYPFLCDYKRICDMGLDVDSYSGIRSYFRNYDPRHEREEEIFTKLGYVDCSNLAAMVQAKVYMQTGLNDRACPPSTQFAAYNRIPGEKKYELYPDYGHEFLLGANDRFYQTLLEL